MRILRPYVSDYRAERIEAVVARRTYAIAPVVEGLTDGGNVSAVMRSAEALGLQPFHMVGASTYQHSARTAQGAEKWLDVFQWTAVDDCLAYLRSAGYQIAATLPDTDRTIRDLEFGTRRIALVFGNEKNGVSRAMAEAADVHVVVPMFGFGQSYNVSVAAGICLYHARIERDRVVGTAGDLTEEERSVLRADFYARSVKHGRSILARMLR